MSIKNKLLHEAVSGSVVNPSEGQFEICIIKAGWGSSGYYPEEVLKRDGATTWPVGTQSYLNHESLEEMWSRPERTVQEICGYISSTPEWKEDGAVGAGLYANLNVFPSQVEFITERMNLVGMSIRAYAEGEYGEKDGRYGHIVTQFIEGVSVDVVTMAGAGGAITGVLESKNLATDDKRFLAKMMVEMRGRGEQHGLTAKDRELLEALSSNSFPVNPIVENKKGFKMDLTEETGKSLLTQLEAFNANAALLAKPVEQPKAGPTAVEVGRKLGSSGLSDRAQELVVEAVANGGDLDAKIKEFQEISGIDPTNLGTRVGQRETGEQPRLGFISGSGAGDLSGFNPATDGQKVFAEATGRWAGMRAGS